MKIYIRCKTCEECIDATDYSKFSDVFMLMQKFNGGIDCIGKFYATNLWDAKEALKEEMKKHPELRDAELYVSKYNAYFDTEENRADPDGVEFGVFDNLGQLVKEFAGDYKVD